MTNKVNKYYKKVILYNLKLIIYKSLVFYKLGF